jgi:hypothetical protein
MAYLKKNRCSHKSIDPRLLEPEDIEILDGSRKPKTISVTRHGITHEITALLKKGLTSTSVGGFFFIPYMLQLNIFDLISKMGESKLEGIPNENIAIGFVFESLFGYTKGIRSIDSVSRADFALLAGLPFLPSPITQYRYLQNVSCKSALDFQVALGRKLVALGQITPGTPINIDGHNVGTYSRKEMKRSYITKEGRYGKAIRCFYTQDQTSKKPLIAMATYSGTTVAQATDEIAARTRDILGDKYMLVADKEWYCGRLIQELHEQYGINILVPVKKSSNRAAEFESIPLGKYQNSKIGNIAAVYTTMKDFNGPLKMFLKKQPDGKMFALITAEQTMESEIALPTYTKRWRIEGFFNENAFLGINHLPSLNLNAIQTMLSFRLVAYHVLDNFRNDLGTDYAYKTPETIYREFINGVQGRIELKNDTIIVHVYNFKHAHAVASIMNNLEDKLLKANVDPHIPWLGNRRLAFRFH